MPRVTTKLPMSVLPSSQQTEAQEVAKSGVDAGAIGAAATGVAAAGATYGLLKGLAGILRFGRRRKFTKADLVWGVLGVLFLIGISQI